MDSELYRTQHGDTFVLLDTMGKDTELKINKMSKKA